MTEVLPFGKLRSSYRILKVLWLSDNTQVRSDEWGEWRNTGGENNNSVELICIEEGLGIKTILEDRLKVLFSIESNINRLVTEKGLL
ncbi:MAG: hypothetical protein K0Q73_8832 [Paenibacillus sp.]|jgi:hypothetical protein|nr:hypothetical protein [Paenibacillus sp.]